MKYIIYQLQGSKWVKVHETTDKSNHDEQVALYNEQGVTIDTEANK